MQNLEENLGVTIRFGDFTEKEAVSRAAAATVSSGCSTKAPQAGRFKHQKCTSSRVWD